MKTTFAPQNRSSAGHALLLVLCITTAMMIMLAGTLNRTIGTSSLNARNNQYMTGLYAADAATEKIYSMMKADFLSGNLAAVTNNLALYRTNYPGSRGTENAYWNQFQFSDGQGHVNQTTVTNTLTAYQISTNWGSLPSQYAGLSGWTNNYRIVSNVKQIANTLYSMTNACQLDVGVDLIPVFQFAIFYNSLLEFTWCAPMTVNGRTHANGNIYTGTAWSLVFNSLVTKSGTLSSPAWDGHATSEYTVATTFNAGYSTNCQSLTLPMATTNVHQIIEIPPTSEDPNSALGQQRYYNKADLLLMVSNSTVTLTLRDSPTDPQATNIVAYYTNSPVNIYPSNYVNVTTNFPFLNITNVFTEQREGSDKVYSTDIDMGLLNKWLMTNSAANAKFPNTAGVYGLTNVPNILYAADNRTRTASQLPAVRLKNGTTIPTNMVSIAGANTPTGLTVATPDPLYILGMYNAPTAYQGTTNTTTTFPASLVSDALTILSPSWLDTQSATVLGSSKNTAANTTVNAAILTGIVPSTGSSSTTFSGGVHNLPRLLEDWSKATLTLNTSIVNMFPSQIATHQFQNPGAYYQAPTRMFNFNLNYLDYTKQPPGTPMLAYIVRSKWTLPPPNTINYAGN